MSSSRFDLASEQRKVTSGRYFANPLYREQEQCSSHSEVVTSTAAWEEPILIDSQRDGDIGQEGSFVNSVEENSPRESIAMSRISTASQEDSMRRSYDNISYSSQANLLPKEYEESEGERSVNKGRLGSDGPVCEKCGAAWTGSIEQECSCQKKFNWKKCLMGVLILGAVAGMFVALAATGKLQPLLTWIKKIGIFGNLVMVVLFTLLGFPFAIGYTPLALAAGFLWGVVWGTVTICLGSFLGCTLVFFLCKTTWREYIEEKFINKKPVLLIFLKHVQKNAFKIIFLGRLTPIPFGIQNVVYSISPISYPVYITASILGLVPEQIMLTFFGKKMENLGEIMGGHRKLSTLEKLMPIGELVLIIVLICFITYLGRRALKQAMQENEEQMDTEKLVEGNADRSSSSIDTRRLSESRHSINSDPGILAGSRTRMGNDSVSRDELLSGNIASRTDADMSFQSCHPDEMTGSSLHSSVPSNLGQTAEAPAPSRESDDVLVDMPADSSHRSSNRVGHERKTSVVDQAIGALIDENFKNLID
eukprot:Nk52_evm10s288 gene=Nk52_evmTU10s288